MSDLNTKVFRETKKAWKDDGVRVILNCGGTRSGKTYSILMLLALIAHGASLDGHPVIISVVTQTFPQLRTGAMRDFERIVPALLPSGSYEENKSNHSWKIRDSLIEFFSADQYEKVLGAQRDYLFINECNRLGYEVVRQLMVRTSMKVFLDYNPVTSFWVNDHILTRNDYTLIHSTYENNKKHLSPAQIAEIESHKKDRNWWRVYGEGLEGRMEGLVFPDWDIVPEFPEGCRVRYGIDFGFNDPTAIVRAGVIGDDLYLDELCYEVGLISADISSRLAYHGVQKRADRIIGDSAAAVQIETLHRDGWNIHPCKKGPGSIMAGISTMKRYKIHLTATSQNLQREFLNYTWEKDKDEKAVDMPIDSFNHAIDACRYATGDLVTRTGSYSLGFVK